MICTSVIIVGKMTKIELRSFETKMSVCLDSHSISYNYTSFTYTPNIQTQVSTFSYK